MKTKPNEFTFVFNALKLGAASQVKPEFWFNLMEDFSGMAKQLNECGVVAPPYHLEWTPTPHRKKHR